MELPICPCGSQKKYENCCFKKKDKNGDPLFHKGAFFTDEQGSWHPFPNFRFAVTIVTKAIDKYRAHAADIVAKSKLNEKHREKFINLYGVFYKSYDQLLESLRKTGGKGVAFETDSVESRKHWKDFFFHGRILIHFLGERAKETLDLKREIGSLNDRGYNNLLVALDEVKKQDIRAEVEKIKDKILTFIDFRDKEKLFKDTIISFPATDSEFGVIKDGEISLDGKNFGMISFVNDSYKNIEELITILLQIKK